MLRPNIVYVFRWAAYDFEFCSRVYKAFCSRGNGIGVRGVLMNPTCYADYSLLVCGNVDTYIFEVSGLNAVKVKIRLLKWKRGSAE